MPGRLLALLLVTLLIAAPDTAITAQTDRVETILDGMSLEQKVGQIFMVNLYGPELTQAGRDVLQVWQPGAVVLLPSNITAPGRIARLTNSYQQTITQAGGAPLFIATDQEGGLIARLREGFTIWPAPMLLTATADPELIHAVGAAMAAELRAVGVNFNLAPVADLNTNIYNPIIGRRSPGSDPGAVGLMVAQFIRGLQDAGVMASAKHFPGHGDTSEDSHVELPVLNHDRARLDAVELPPFIQAMDAGVGAVMMGHLWLPQLEPVANMPASLSQAIVTGLLRDDLGYEGIIMTDALDMDAIDTVYSPGEAAVRAIEAGNDMILIGANVGEAVQIRAMQTVVDAVRAGRLPESQIDDSVRRILSAKARFGILDWTPLDVDQAQINLDSMAATHAALVQAVFDAGVTLAYDAHELVPARGSVGVIYPANRPGARAACDSYGGDVRWLAVSDRPDEAEAARAASLARQVETIIVFTRDAYYNEAQQRLVRALPPQQTVVVALVSPFDWLRFDSIGAYVVTYSPLEPALQTACAVLFGARPARGHLVVTLSDALPAAGVGSD